MPAPISTSPTDSGETSLTLARKRGFKEMVASSKRPARGSANPLTCPRRERQPQAAADQHDSGHAIEQPGPRRLHEPCAAKAGRDRPTTVENAAKQQRLRTSQAIAVQPAGSGR